MTKKPAAEPKSLRPGTARLFMDGKSQAVRLPRAFRFKGDSVRIRKQGDAVVLEPLAREFKSTAEWFAELDRLNELAGEPFMPDGREQPAMPPDRKIFD